MLNLELINIAQSCGAQVYLPDGMLWDDYKNTKVAGVYTDSRKVVEASVFVAILGERVDGHDYITDVFEKGAAAVICERLPEKIEGICFKVENSVEALQKVAECYRHILGDGLKVVGITGSVGKTSTREFVASVLSQQFRVHQTHGNQNNLIGLPLEILSIEPDTEIAVLEMGISDFNEMTRLSAMACPDVAVITNIGECHLECLGDRDGVLKAKTEIFSSMRTGCYAILNGADDKLETVREVMGSRPLRFGRQQDDAMAEVNRNMGLLGTDVTIHINREPAVCFTAHVPLPGRHMVTNAVAASLVGRVFDMDCSLIKEGIEAVKATKGRSNVIKTQKYVLIDDCYNANPVSMKAAINMLSCAEGRTVAILGDMFELGDNRLELHREVGEYASKAGIDVIICVGEMSKYMRDGALCEVSCEGKGIYYFETKEKLLQKLDSILMEGDTILVKASNGMKFAEVIEKLQA